MTNFVLQSNEVGFDTVRELSGSLGEIFGHVADGRARSRADIARISGLARSTVSHRVNALLDARLLVEDAFGPSSGGRPPVSIRINPSAGLMVAADIGATHLRVAVTDLAGSMVAEHSSDLLISNGPATVLDEVSDVIGKLLTRSGYQLGDVRGIGVGVPGPVQFATGTVIRPPIMPGWDGVSIPDHFRARFAVPVLVDNDVNLMALGEYGARDRSGELLLFIRIGSGIGCGIVDDGRVHRGADGAAGDIGHIQLVDVGDALCVCGNVGCVEAVASGSAIARQLTAVGIPAANSSDVVKLVQEANLEAKQAIRVASTRIGSIVATLVNCYNPSVIIVGGPLAPLQDDLLAGIRAVVYQRATPLGTRSLAIEGSRLNEQACVVGALALIRSHLFSAAGLNALVGGST